MKRRRPLLTERELREAASEAGKANETHGYADDCRGHLRNTPRKGAVTE
jgi:hypothetical protein